MRIVRIVRRSVRYNPHINNVGEVAVVIEECGDGLQVCTASGGFGAVDKDSVQDNPTITFGQRATLEHQYRLHCEEEVHDKQTNVEGIDG